MEKELNSKKIILTLIGFVVFWAIITDAWGYSDYIFNNDPYNIGTYIYGYISRLIWVIPAILLIIRYDNKLKYNKKELFSRPKFNKSLILFVTISLVYVVIGMLINHKGFWFNRLKIRNFQPRICAFQPQISQAEERHGYSVINLSLVSIKYIIVGFVEETVFRGWGYNSLANTLSHKKAAIITTVLFILLHWPSYFIKFLKFGVFDFTGIIIQSISVLIWGFVFCWLLKKGNTIWNPIAAHIIYDLMCVLLLGGI